MSPFEAAVAQFARLYKKGFGKSNAKISIGSWSFLNSLFVAALGVSVIVLVSDKLFGQQGTCRDRYGRGDHEAE